MLPRTLLVLVALLTRLDVLLMGAATRTTRLLLTRAGRRGTPSIVVHALVAFLASLDVLFVGSTLVCHWIISFGFADEAKSDLVLLTDSGGERSEF